MENEENPLTRAASSLRARAIALEEKTSGNRRGNSKNGRSCGSVDCGMGRIEEFGESTLTSLTGLLLN